MANFDNDALHGTGGAGHGDKFSYMPVQTKPGQFKTTSSKDAVGKLNATVKPPAKPPTTPKSSGMKKGGKRA